jgi:hypothetical protein
LHRANKYRVFSLERILFDLYFTVNKKLTPARTTGVVGMNDIVVDLDLGTPEEQALWEMAVDFFVGLLDSGEGVSELDAPDMMVRTAFKPNGHICKQLIFQDRTWADAFLDFWEEQKLQAAAA